MGKDGRQQQSTRTEDTFFFWVIFYLLFLGVFDDIIGRYSVLLQTE